MGDFLSAFTTNFAKDPLKSMGTSTSVLLPAFVSSFTLSNDEDISDTIESQELPVEIIDIAGSLADSLMSSVESDFVRSWNCNREDLDENFEGSLTVETSAERGVFMLTKKEY